MFVRRLPQQRLGTSVYCKAAHTDRVFNFSSNDARNAKAAVVRSLFGRLETHLARNDENGKREEEQHIRNILHANGYPDRFTNSVFLSMGTKRKENQDGEIGGRDELWSVVPHVKGLSEAILGVLRPLSTVEWRTVRANRSGNCAQA